MKSRLVCSIIVVFNTMSLSVSAEGFSWADVTFQPRVYSGYANYTLEAGTVDVVTMLPDGGSTTSTTDWSLISPGRQKITSTGLLLGIGGTVALDRFFADVYYQSTPNEIADSGGQVQEEVGTRDIGNTHLQHSDWAFSLGYMITDQWSMFAGYKSGSTEWDQYYIATLNDGKITERNFFGKFEQDGPFLGTAYSFRIDPGVLSIKVAYAYLDGNDKEDAWFSGNRAEHVQYDFSGNSHAYSTGLAWTQYITESIGFSIGANYHNYKFNLSDSGIRVNNNTSKTFTNLSMTEELLTLTASLVYQF